MKRLVFAILFLLCLSELLPAQVTIDIQGEQGMHTQKAAPASGPVADSNQPPPSLANADVIRMVKAGLAESTILLAIEHRPAVAFDTSPDALIELKTAGVSQTIMDAMLRKGTPPALSGGSAGIPSGSAALPSTEASLPNQQTGPPAQQEPVKRPALTSIRKLYLTGTKDRAIKAAVNDLAWHTCLVAVTDPSESDATVVLEQSRFLMLPPDRSTSGILNCSSSARGASCTDTGSGETTAITCNGAGTSCGTSTYNSYALYDAAGSVVRALFNRALTRATILDKNHAAVLWLFDEGRDNGTKGAGFYSTIWWGELNTAVGCGKATVNPHKHWKEGQWPEPTEANHQ